MRCNPALVLWGLLATSAILSANLLAQPPAESKPATKQENPKYWKEALTPIKDQPGLPRVLLIGDSVSVGYTLFTRELLKSEANVHRILENGGHTRQAIPKMDGWLGTSKWDVIHFNWGLHDLR